MHKKMYQIRINIQGNIPKCSGLGQPGFFDSHICWPVGTHLSIAELILNGCVGNTLFKVLASLEAERGRHVLVALAEAHGELCKLMLSFPAYRATCSK